MIGRVFADHADRIGARQFGHRQTRGGEQIARLTKVQFDQVNNDFGVGLGCKGKTQPGQSAAQSFVIFDNPVMHHRQTGADVRMRIGLRGRAVRGPARVCNAEVTMSMDGSAFFGQRGDAPHAAHALQSTIDGDQTRRIVAAIFQPPQPFKQDGNDVTLRHRADYATHRLVSFFLFGRPLPAGHRELFYARQRQLFRRRVLG